MEELISWIIKSNAPDEHGKGKGSGIFGSFVNLRVLGGDGVGISERVSDRKVGLTLSFNLLCSRFLDLISRYHELPSMLARFLLRISLELLLVMCGR